MPITDTLEQARRLSWQYGCKVLVVLDLLTKVFKVFTMPHADYLELQPTRYVTLKTYRDGVPE